MNYTHIHSCQCDETHLPAIQIICSCIPTQVKQEHNVNIINLISTPIHTLTHALFTFPCSLSALGIGLDQQTNLCYEKMLI